MGKDRRGRERKERVEEKEQMTGSDMQWRCQCGQLMPYMYKVCPKCKTLTNHLNMIAMPRASWIMWSDDVVSKMGANLVSLTQDARGREFLNAGITCTFSQYEEWRRRVVQDKANKGLGVSIETYLRKKINEYNIHRLLEEKATGRSMSTSLISETKVYTMAERMEKVRRAVEKGATTDEQTKMAIENVERQREQDEMETDESRESVKPDLGKEYSDEIEYQETLDEEDIEAVRKKRAEEQEEAEEQERLRRRS